MKKMTVEEIRTVQLDMLSYIDKLAREHQIEYSLGGGSLLGAMRHQGFIPWDDDIDLMLERTQYEKLIQVLARQENEDYKILHHSTEKNLWPFAKLYHTGSMYQSKTDRIHPWTGIFIDIFPMDRLPESAEDRERFFKKVHSAAANLMCTTYPNFASGSRRLYAYARLILGMPRFALYHGQAKKRAEMCDQVMMTYDQKDVPYVGYTDSRYRLREFFPREVFEHYEDVAFEDLNVRKIKDDHAYLHQLYGENYMELPPEDKRENHSYYTWYWKER
ncbi:LicD family protein [Streptococcus sp. DD13]|uniref:LicD family protein n=1 Tax=Streptococcus sp. DD13 TaxID=1777881 RepID=UPI000791D830|nr:LicD family protein [Streptococcus sp. DD13]KXT79146.1 Lipopolysaccharide cholinephosphotransferase LicD1 [Streptococcus sp. DD13]